MSLGSDALPTLVLTGATSGFGLAALPRLSKDAGRIIVGARQPLSLSDQFGDQIEVIPLDLASLNSTEAFCAAVHDTLGDARIDGLGLNAGITTMKPSLTEDGFGRTFQTNYLSHWVIFRRLQGRLSEGARVVTTGSGTHDPREKTPTQPPRHLDAQRLAEPHTDPERDRSDFKAGSRAYTASKAACIAMAREMARRHPSLNPVSFDPGFLPETQLMREAPKLLAAIVKPIIKSVMARDRTGTVETSARVWGDLLLGVGPTTQPGGYIAMRGGQGFDHRVSELVSTPGVAGKLWDDTEALLADRL